MVPLGLAQAATVRVAYQLGRSEPSAARRAAYVALAMGVLFMTPAALLLWTTPRISSPRMAAIGKPSRRMPGTAAPSSDNWLALAQLRRCASRGEEGKGMDNRAFASATELANHIIDRRIGCVELLDFYLARAERHNPALNAIVVWQIDQARERARAADAALARGERWGPLHGVPMTVKESFNVAGLPTTFGNPQWKDNIATGNAFLIDRLLQAGAIVFGKTNVP
jgi:hypothetical protein